MGPATHRKPSSLFVAANATTHRRKGGMAHELAALIGGRFVERRDVLAVQRADGTYQPARRPMKLGDLRAHLAGKSIGHYLVSPEGRCRLFAFDIDLRAEARQAWREHRPEREELTVELRCLAEALALRTRSLLEVPVAIAWSGSKGLHVYGWCGSIPAADAKDCALMVLSSFRNQFAPARGRNFYRHTTGYTNVEIEVFPKQISLDGKDLGNLMRLPLGINRKSGEPGYFLDLHAGMDTFRPADPEPILAHGADW